MNRDLHNRLKSVSERLHQRALSLSTVNADEYQRDTALLMSANALQMEALWVLADDIRSLKSLVDNR